MTVEERFWAKVRKTDECWTWTAQITTTGYGHFWSGTHRDRAHRFSWELHYGPIPAGMFVLHRCDNKPCVRPDHLWLGTALDNSADMVAKGRASRLGNRGSQRKPSVRLTPEDVKEIWRLYERGGVQRQIAARFGVTPPAINAIIRGKTWRKAA